MTNKEINKTIAEWMGNKEHIENQFIPPDIEVTTRTMENIPDYCNDLNAIHEAEKKLSLIEREAYYQQLRNVRVCDRLHKMTIIVPFLCINASARNRAEALLKIIGKWKD